MELLVIGLGVYGAIGLVAGAALAILALGRMDPGVEASPWSVRLLFLPGLVALWPVMLFKWARLTRGGGAGEGAAGHGLGTSA